MKYIILYIITISYSFALTEDEIIELNKKPHDNTELMEELQIFPNSRKISSELTINTPDNQIIKDTIISTSKNIDGKYILNEMKIIKEDIDLNFINIITYSEDTKIYKMWSRTRTIYKDKDPISFVIESDGLHIVGSNYITWSQKPQQTKTKHSVIISQLNPKGERWVSYEYTNGEITTTIKGVDTLIKE